MRTPRWLADELTDAVKKVGLKLWSRPDALEHLTATAYEKDEEWVLGVLRERLSTLLDGRTRKRQRLVVNALKRKAADATGSSRQLGFDDVCSYFFPPDTFPTSTLLAEARAYADDLLGRAERHHGVAKERVEFVERMLAAVGGNDQASLGEALTALRESGDAAAEG